MEIRNLGKSRDVSYTNFKDYIESDTPEVAANVVICLIHQANYLLDRQMEFLEKDFLKHGGFRERLSKARRNIRNGNFESHE